VGMVGKGSRSSFDWWYFQKDWSSFEFSLIRAKLCLTIRIN
jgi:hypothetical protein